MEYFRYALLAARLLQIVGGFSVFLFSCLTAANGTGWIAGWYMSADAIPGAIVMLLGSIGLFAFKRPNDIHWHLVLSLDWLALLSAVASCVLSTQHAYGSNCVWWYLHANQGSLSAWCGLMLPTFIFSYVNFTVSIVPLVRTHVMMHKGMLPPAHYSTVEWHRATKDNEDPPAYVDRDSKVSSTAETGFYSNGGSQCPSCAQNRSSSLLGTTAS